MDEIKMAQSNNSFLYSHTGFWMRMVSNSISASFARKLSANGVTVAEWVILRNMYESNGITSCSVIADLTHLTRGAVSKLITRLLKKNLVIRRESCVDRRYHDIELTQTGLMLVPQLSELADQNEIEFFSLINKEECKILHDILVKIAHQHKLTKTPIY